MKNNIINGKCLQACNNGAELSGRNSQMKILLQCCPIYPRRLASGHPPRVTVAAFLQVSAENPE